MLPQELNPDSETQITRDLFTLLKLENDTKDDVKSEEIEASDNHDDEDEGGDLFTLLKLENDTKDEDVKSEEIEASDNHDDEDEAEEEFSFACVGANSSPIAAEDAFINGQIKPYFPLFNGDLFFSGEDSDGLRNLPMRPPVKKVFVETSEDNSPATSSAPAESERWSERKAVEASPEICKKSNSTGFSKIWRFRDLLGRSNSEGRDAFVFLNNSHAPPSTAEHPAAKSEDKSAKKESKVKVKKGKTASLSAHEVYLKSKGKEEGRRRSYLPYRPELMGFFTNVNGGLSKNVHPF